MTSATWLVNAGSNRYVAKLVPHGMRNQFEAGLSAAEHLHQRNLDAGRPVRAIDGQLSCPIEGNVLGLMNFVDGRPLDGADPVDQQWWGDRLGRAHQALTGFAHPGLPAWHWVRLEAVHLGMAAWLRPAVARAVQALEKLQVTDRLTFGTLHGDPACGAFLLDQATGRVGIIDWGSAVSGPLVYDLASAVMYAGGIEHATGLVDAYAATGMVPMAEIEAALPTLLNFRWAVQADFFAHRVMRENNEENRKGLQDAHEALLG
jgi:Ser/Thr protein kinase RdoA (MazF antagonist)